MPAFCTCGTELAPDSLFCHKCGKPQRDIPDYQPEPQAVEAPPIPQVTSVEPAQVNFHNGPAVRVAFMVAVIGALLSRIPVVGVLYWGAAGYFAVLLYQRRTGALLNVKSGMRLGRITGVLLSLFNMVLMTTDLVPAAANGTLRTLMRQQIKNPGDPNIQEALRFLDSGPGLALVVLTGLTMVFVVIMILSMAGGALGAKFSSRGR
jgi:hypothetical protein